MRETFEDVWSLMRGYESVRSSMTAMPTLAPKRDYEQISRKSAGKIIQSKMESNLAFIADVELFVKWFYMQQKGYVPVPEDCLMDIFHNKFCKGISKFNSYGHLALHYRNRIRRGEKLPRRLTYRENISDIAKSMQDKIEDYYVGKGLIALPDV